MASLDEMMARYNELSEITGTPNAFARQDPAPQPQAPPDDRGWFTGHALPAVANFIPKFIHASGEGMYGIAGALSGDSDEEIELAKRQRANLYGDIAMDKAPSRGAVDTVTDFVGDVAPSVAATAVQAYALGGLAGSLGAGATTGRIAGDVAAGAYMGMGESPEEAAIQGAQFGLGGLPGALLPRRFGALARAGTGALAQGGAAAGAEVLRGRDLSDPEVQRSIALQAAFPVAMEGIGALGRRFGRKAPSNDVLALPAPRSQEEMLRLGGPGAREGSRMGEAYTPDEVIYQQNVEGGNQGNRLGYRGEPMALPAPGDASMRLDRGYEPQQEWHPQTAEDTGLRLAGLEPTPYVEPPVPQPNTINPRRLGQRSTAETITIDPEPEVSIRSVIENRGVVNIGGQEGKLQWREDGVTFRPHGTNVEQRVYGNIADDPITNIEGATLVKPGQTRTQPKLRKLGTKAQEGSISAPMQQYLGGATAGAVAGAYEDDENPLAGALMGATAGVGLVAGGRRLRGVAKDFEAARLEHLKGRHTTKGVIAQFAHENFTSGTPEQQRLRLTREGVPAELADRYGKAMRYLNSEVSPADLALIDTFENSPRTPADLAAMHAAVSPEAKAAHTEALKMEGEMQDIVEGAQTAKNAKAVSATRETYRARLFDFSRNPKQWVEDPVKRAAVIAEAKTNPDVRKIYPDFFDDKGNVIPERDAELTHELGLDLGDRTHSELTALKGGKDPLRATGSRQGRDLFKEKKDLTPPQYEFAKKLSSDVRLDPHEDAVMKHVTQNGVDYAAQEQFATMSKMSKFTPEERAMFDAMSKQEIVGPAMRDYKGEIKGTRALLGTIQKLHRSVGPAAMHTEVIHGKDNAGNSNSLSPEEYKIRRESAALRKDTAEQSLLDTYKLVPADTQGVGAVAGRFVQRDLIDAMDIGVKGPSLPENEKGAYASFTKFYKQVFTVGNPGSYGKNWAQVYLQGLSAGIRNPMHYYNAAKRFANDPVYRSKRIQQGIGVARSDDTLARVTDLPSSLGKALGAADKIADAGKRLLAQLHALYNYPDLLVRLASMDVNEARYLKKGMSPEAAERAAIDFTNRRTHDPTNTPKVVKFLSNVPGINPFLRYTAGTARILKNLAHDVVHGNPEDRMSAIVALTANVAAVGAAGAAASALLSDKDKADWEKENKLSPSYRRGQLRLVTGRDQKTGDFRAFNLTPWMVAGDIVATAKNILNGDIEASLKENPFAGITKSPVLNMAASQINGEEYMTGRKLFNGWDRARSVLGSITPPAVSALTAGMDEPIGYLGQKMAQGFAENAEGGRGLTNARTGRSETPATAIASLFGASSGTTNLRRLQANIKRDADEEIAQRKSDLKRKLQTNIPSAAKSEAIRKFGEQRKAITEELNRRLGQR